MIKKHYPLITVITLLIASCSSNSDNKTEKPEEINKAFLQNVKTTKATLSNQKEELTLTGKVEYDPDKVISYVPLISGIVERTYFSLGDKVSKGQSLLDIRSADLSSLHSESISSENEVKIAKRELQTAQSMFEDKMLSEKELLGAQAQLKQAQAQLDKVRNDMSTYGSSKGNGTFSIKAPMSGYIIEKKTSSGSPVSADGDAIFMIADLSNVWITANVYASNLQFVKEGMEVDITTLSYPGEIFSGKINTLSQVFDPEEKVLKARIVMPNKEMKFKPEMSVVIKLKNETQNRLIAIPSEALVFDANRYFVVVAETDDNFKIKEVEVQGHHDKTTYIRSGLDENDNVVVKNQLLIYSALNGK